MVRQIVTVRRAIGAGNPAIHTLEIPQVKETGMRKYQEEAAELQALADRKGATAPSTSGPNHIVKECMKCGAAGCNLIEANEIR